MSISEIPSKYYSLSKVAKSLQSVIRREYSQYYWIKAEISRLNFYPKSGHCYPDLVEKENGKILAQMRAIIWSSDYYRINAEFVKKTGNPLSDGMEILFRAQLEFNPIHGISLMIKDVSAEFVVGKMALEKSKTIARLKEEGLFHRNKELSFPILPQRIAIISVETSKGFSDFLNIIDNNSRGYKFFWMLFPALLQGDGAVASIMQQLEQIRLIKHHFDLVAIIRGGGGDVGLSCYDNYDLAKTVADFCLPVVSGIGHSTNETIVEMVSHYNPITPTDLAYYLQQKFDNIAVHVENLNSEMVNFTKEYLIENRKILDKSVIELMSCTNRELSVRQTELNNHSQVMQHKSHLVLQEQKFRINQSQKSISLSSKRLNRKAKENMEFLGKRIVKSTSAYIEKHEIMLLHTQEKINLMHPNNLLKKGYSLTYCEGKLLKDIRNTKIGDTIKTRVYKGELESIISKTDKK